MVRRMIECVEARSVKAVRDLGIDARRFEVDQNLFDSFTRRVVVQMVCE